MRVQGERTFEPSGYRHALYSTRGVSSGVASAYLMYYKIRGIAIHAPLDGTRLDMEIHTRSTYLFRPKRSWGLTYLFYRPQQITVFSRTRQGQNTYTWAYQLSLSLLLPVSNLATGKGGAGEGATFRINIVNRSKYLSRETKRQRTGTKPCSRQISTHHITNTKTRKNEEDAGNGMAAQN